MKAEEMQLMLNVKDCGLFDDIVLTIGEANKKDTTYLIQVKYKENPKNISSEEFLSRKPDFNLKKYVKSCVEVQKVRKKSKLLPHLPQNHEELNFVLFTNRQVSETNCLKSVQDNSDLQFINTNNGNIWTFEFEKLGMTLNSDEKEYANKLYFYSNQISRRNLDLEIIKKIKSIVPIDLPQKALNSLFKKFTWFISDWSKGYVGGHYALTKAIVIKKLMELLLDPYMVQLDKVENYNSFNRTFWKDLLYENRVTVIDADDVVDKFLKAYINGEIIERRKAGVSYEEYHHSIEYDLLWKSGKLPLLLQFHTLDAAQNIVRVLEEFQTFVQVTVIVLNRSPNSSAELKIKDPIITLADLKYKLQDVVLKHSIKLQGKSIVLKPLVSEDMFKLLTMKKIIYILLGMLSIGKEAPNLPDFFIKRSMPAILLTAEVLKEVSDEAFIVHCASEKDFQIFLEKNAVSTCVYKQLQKQNKTFCGVCTGFFIDWDDSESSKTYTKTQTVHHLYLNVSELEWVQSTGSIKNLRPYRKEKALSSDINVTQELLHRFCCKRVSKPFIIIAGPGMGKSTILNYLARQAPNLCTISVQLFENKTYFVSDELKMALFNPEEFLRYFSGISAQTCEFTKTLFENYVSSNKVLVLFDGFDEILTDCKEEATKMIQKLVEEGYPVFVTSRPVAKIYLETVFDTFSYTLAPFSKDDKAKFLVKALSSNTGKTKKLVQSVVERVLSKVDSNPGLKNMVESGLFLQLLSELNFKDCERIEDLDFIFLIDNYIQKEFGSACDKSKSDSLYFDALQRVFSKDILIKSDIYKNIINSNFTFSKVSPFIDEKVFAEYLSAKWLSQNTENKKLIKEIFHPHYNMTRNFFDQILAKNHSLHLAIVKKQKDVALVLGRSNKNILNDVDEGGRTVLHLSAAWGVHHLSNPSEEEIADLKQSTLDEIPTLFAAIHINRINSKDKLLNYTPLEYALASGSLNIANAICQRLQFFKLSSEISISNINTNYVNQYIRIFQYDHLKSVLDKYFSNLEGTPAVPHEKNMRTFAHEGDEGYCTMPRSSQALTSRNQKPIETEDSSLLLGAAQKGYTDIMYSLISKGADLEFQDKTYGKTALILAVERGHTEAVTLLLSKGANLEATDNDWMTSLHWAAYCGHVSVLNLLLAKKANVEAKDKDGMTPLHWAAYKGQIDAVELLLLKNASLESKNVGGLTPWNLAKSNGHEKIVLILENQ